MARAGSTFVGALMVALALAGSSAAQEPAPRHTRPVPIAAPHVLGQGHAETWDGRVFVIANFDPAQGDVGWRARVLRPEGVRVGPDGVPSFGDEAWSPFALLESVHTPASVTGMTFGGLNGLAIVPTPGLAPNPFPSDARGAAQPGGAYETYEFLVFTQMTPYVDGRIYHLGVRRGRIVVREPRTARAAVERAEMLSPFADLRSTTGTLLHGIEPTVTIDGRLVIWQGHPDNDNKGDTLLYSWNHQPGAATGWSPPRSIIDMHAVDRATLVDGVRFDERFPIAQRPLRTNDGQLYQPGDLYRGAYPWISHDGSELFHPATIAGQPGTPARARRGGLAVIGRLTGWTLRHIDGPLNPNREATTRLFFSSPGLAPGFWTPFRDAAARPIPYTSSRPVYPLFGSNTADYGEVSFEDVADGDYSLVLRMNEVIPRDHYPLQPTLTPDTSGHHQTGRLERGAAFPQEYEQQDTNRGVVGQAIYFTDTASVRVTPAAEGLQQVRDAITVELFVKRLVDLGGDADNRFRYLLEQPGAYHLILEESGHVNATVLVGGRARRVGFVGPALPLDRWAHVAFTYEGATGRLRVFVDGALAGEQTFGAGPIDRSASDLVLGPAGRQPPKPGVAANQAIYLLDEVKVSRVARADVEVAASAFRDLPRAALTGRLHVPLPRGLSPADLRVPAGRDTTAEAAELGKLLFFDPRLSRDGTVACSTCHDPAKAFTDGLPKGVGLGGRTLERNTPTVLNRALSTRQFFDGRAASLEEQALMPIEHPDEMGLGVPQAVAFLQSVPQYRDRFQAAFGQGPSAETLGRALAAFQRTLLSGDSRVDRYEAGDRAALTPAEERGRVLFHGEARCSACHVGSNFTDEAFHDTAQVVDRRDLGLGGATGRAGDRGRFKTPTLRDVARTAPYLHDGSARTLEEVVDLYDRGGLRVEGRDVEVRPLGLTSQERSDLVAFLRALDGTTVTVTPPTLPPGPNGEPAPQPGSSTLRPQPPAPATPVATPVIASRSGGFFSRSARVTITCATAGATIRYTTDGSAPTASSPIYQGPFTVKRTTTIKARAFASGQPDSATAERRVRVKRWYFF